MEEEPIVEKQAKAKKRLLSKELHTAIIAHPDYRVCWKIPGNDDAMRPLEYAFSQKALLFKEDFASTYMHPHGLCSSILDLIGREIPEQMGNGCVRIRKVYMEDWKDSYVCRKITYDHDAKWILLWTDKQ